MKKIKFFAMALAALTIASCSKEQNGPDVNPPVVEGVETYATFSFDIEGSGVKSRGASEVDDAEGVATGDAAIKDIRIAIFNAKGILEETSVFTTDKLTNQPIKLTSGTKKIFVFANSKNTANFPALVKGTTSLTDCYGSDISLMNGTTFSIMGLVSTTNGYYMSSARTKNSTQTLVPGITSDQSQAGGVSENHFTFNVQRGVSKLQTKLADDNVLKVGDKTTPTAVLSGMSYTVRNINKSIAPVQLFSDEEIVDNAGAMEKGIPMAAFFTKFDSWTTTPAGEIPADPTKEMTIKENFHPFYDRSFEIDQTLTSTFPANNIFVTENTNARQVIGNTSYLAVKGTYTPSKVVTACTYDPDFQGGSFTSITESTATAGNSFWKVDLTGLEHIGGVNKPLTNNLFSAKDVASGVLDLVLEANGIAPNADAGKQKIYDDAVAARLLEYKKGVTYYRLNIGKTDKDGKVTFGIRRNSKYQITINNITKLGVNDESKLDDNPEIPVTSQETFVTATIKVSEWNEYTQGGDL